MPAGYPPERQAYLNLAWRICSQASQGEQVDAPSWERNPCRSRGDWTNSEYSTVLINTLSNEISAIVNQVAETVRTSPSRNSSKPQLATG
ncbi:uncharacterized protein RSE6_09488 [Rhynchosporium secalis]|uniref:Uncharacterized protein n=1 Tax=Rhynchosporium secalis TaxID=38038 RepID=A0A1E1MI04_RHYSE|nr:uncharacterized protein RSE6_09488 [Rhynchosporium secalis]